MKRLELTPAFRRQMLFLALLAGVLVGILLPTIYSRGLSEELHQEAELHARAVAARLQHRVSVQPELWAYDLDGLDNAVAPLLLHVSDARIQVEYDEDKLLYAAGDTPENGVTGWAVIRISDQAVARVGVTLSDAPIRTKMNRAWLLSGGLGVGLSISLFLLPLIKVQRSDRANQALWNALEASKEELESRVEARTIALRELGDRLVRVQEEERARISRDLHDELGQTLTGLRLRLSTAELVMDESSPAREHLLVGMNAIDSGIEQVRAIAHHLRPPELDSLGLRNALVSHAENWSAQAGLELGLNCQAVNPDIEISEALFRTAQEALTNVARHARATRVQVSLETTDDVIRMSIEDDGIGMAKAADDRLGLIGIRERLRKCNGQLILESGDLGGVKLSAVVPLMSDREEQG